MHLVKGLDTGSTNIHGIYLLTPCGHMRQAGPTGSTWVGRCAGGKATSWQSANSMEEKFPPTLCVYSFGVLTTWVAISLYINTLT